MTDMTIYERLARQAAPEKHVVRHVLLAFLGGGVLALILQGTYDLMTENGIQTTDALLYNALMMIVLTMVLTLFGAYKRLAQIFGAGLFIPITGFANSVISEGIEYRSEGPIYGVGSRLFSLAGSVLCYSISAAALYGLVLWILSLCGVTI